MAYTLWLESTIFKNVNKLTDLVIKTYRNEKPISLAPLASFVFRKIERMINWKWKGLSALF